MSRGSAGGTDRSAQAPLIRPGWLPEKRPVGACPRAKRTEKGPSASKKAYEQAKNPSTKKSRTQISFATGAMGRIPSQRPRPGRQRLGAARPGGAELEVELPQVAEGLRVQ